MTNEELINLLERELFFHNKNLTKKQFHAVDTIREELQKRCIKHEKMKKKQLEKLQKELGGAI